jgi:hypothetical protein
MFLGIPPAYRNDYDIANAVSTFGKFHYWIENDPFKCRALVYASFPSPALVPRDVVFGKYATVGGVRVSWTAALYILTAEFADALPADEDQMPPDGNPHPLPGQLVINPNMFVAPQFPEIGWDVIQQHEVPQHHGPQHDNVQHMDIQEEVQESMLLNPSQNSDSSVNFHFEQQFLQVGFVSTVTYGPALPPELYWKRLFEFALPEFLSKQVFQSVPISPFNSLMIKGPWTDLMGQSADLFVDDFTSSGASVMDRPDNTSVVSEHRPVARLLSFDSNSDSLAQKAPPLFSETPGTMHKKRGRPRKSQIAVVQPENRRFTRSALKDDGFRPKPVIEKAKTKSKPRAKMLLHMMEPEDGTITQVQHKNRKDSGKEKVTTPATPIVVMQRVGHDLGISPDKLTKDKLEADPSGFEDQSHDD